MKQEKTSISVTYLSVISNVLLAAIKFITGVLGNSFALIADAIESTTDIFSSFLVLFGLKYSNRPPDKNHPYGHGRLEPLITFLVVGFLITSATIIAYESINNILTPHDLPKAWTLYILGGIILWKEIAYRFVILKSKETNSTVLKAEAWHHRSDAITSIAAFLGISIALILGKGYETVDDWAALFSSFLIIYNSYLIFRPALGEIMDEQLYDELINKIKIEAKKVEGILYIEKCFVRKVGVHYHLDLHATVDGQLSVFEGHNIAHNLKNHLRKEISTIGHVLVHIEPDVFK